MPTKPPRIDPRRTHPLVWCAAIICTALAIAVIISGIVVFIAYLVIHPRVPFLTVISAHLNEINFDRDGLLEIQVLVIIRAENDNLKAHATFSDMSFVMNLQGYAIAKLQANKPFEVRKNSSTDFYYEVHSSPIPLDAQTMNYVHSALGRDQIIFQLEGNARARWRVGLLGSVKFGCHLNCQLPFHPSSGNYTSSRCTSKSK